MAERYTRVFQKKEKLYSPNAPVVIQAVALLKDNQTGDILAQIKFKSISVQTIQALTVRICAWDVTGVSVGGIDEYQYLDLKIQRGSEFGQQTAIPLPDAVSRSFACECTQVVFSDGTVWKWDQEKPWMPLPDLVSLSGKLGPELRQQYCRDTIASAQWMPVEHNDLWFCTCGAYNHNNERLCHSCRTPKDTIFNNLNSEVLTQNLNQYRQKQAQEVAEREAQVKNKKIKMTKIGVICGAVAVMAILLVLLSVKLVGKHQKEQAYLSAVQMMGEEKYSDAIAAFETITGYRDTDTLLEECRDLNQQENAYQTALSLLRIGEYADALSAFKNLDKYKDSPDMITETKYQQAISLLTEDAGAAREIFMELEDYKDSPQYLEKIILLCTKEIAVDHTTSKTYENGLLLRTETDYPWQEDSYLYENYSYTSGGILKEIKTEFASSTTHSTTSTTYDEYGNQTSYSWFDSGKCVQKDTYENTYDPNGKLKTCRIKGYNLNSAGELVHVQTIFTVYEENGNYVLTNELTPWNNAGQIVKYDEHGNEIYHEYQYTDKEPSVTIFDNEYDDDGNLLFARIRGTSGYRGYEYDENGTLRCSYYIEDGSSKRSNEVNYEYGYFYVG